MSERAVEAAFRCAEAAYDAGDPVVATAPPAARWILVEHPGPWGRRALSESGIDREVAQALGGWADMSAGRVTLIRRHGRQPVGPRRWFTVDSRPGSEAVRSGTFTDERELLDVVDGGLTGSPVAEPVYLVCAHGRHDTCCAVRGRPVAAALAAAFPARTWECSHVGGDRFAANLVVLPHGLYYGNVLPAAAVGIARDHDGGLLDLYLLRGRSSLPAAVQAAQHHARTAAGERGIGSFPPLDVKAAGAGEWLVTLDGPRCEVAVLVAERTVAAGRRLTCSASGPGSYRTFDLVELTER